MMDMNILQVANLLESNLYKVKDLLKEVKDNFVSSLETLGYVNVESECTNELEEPYWEVYVHPGYVDLINDWLKDEVLDLELISRETGRIIPKGAIVFLNTLDD